MDQKTAAEKTGLSLIQFNEITEPGAYVSQQGDLYRVQEEGLKTKHSPMITKVSKNDTRVTRITDDPFVSLNKARVLAADADLPVNF